MNGILCDTRAKLPPLEQAEPRGPPTEVERR